LLQIQSSIDSWLKRLFPAPDCDSLFAQRTLPSNCASKQIRTIRPS
jgi:hypothetical protein